MFNRLEASSSASENEQKDNKKLSIYTYPKIVLSVDEFAEEFGISLPTAYKLTKEKGFP